MPNSLKEKNPQVINSHQFPTSRSGVRCVEGGQNPWQNHKGLSFWETNSQCAVLKSIVQGMTRESPTFRMTPKKTRTNLSKRSLQILHCTNDSSITTKPLCPLIKGQHSHFVCLWAPYRSIMYVEARTSIKIERYGGLTEWKKPIPLVGHYIFWDAVNFDRFKLPTTAKRNLWWV